MLFCLLLAEVGRCLVSSLDHAEVVSTHSNSVYMSKRSRSLLSCLDLCLSHTECFAALYSEPQRSRLNGKTIMLRLLV